jgi:hypothetical protein
MKNQGQGAARLTVLLCAGLLLFVSCKDMFHTEKPVEKPKQYSVTFYAAGGNPAVQARTITEGNTLGSGMPPSPTRNGCEFGGWYTELGGGGSEFTAGTPVSGQVTVYAWWKMPDNLSLDTALTWLSINAETGGAYTITLINNYEIIAPKTLSYSGKTVGITLTGGTTERTVSLSTTGTLFTVESGVTLTLDNNVTLQGRSDNTASLVRVNSGGRLVMNTGSKITGNISSSSSSSSYGSGVYIAGTFTMNGGTISGNTVSSSYSAYGGGVYFSGSGTFTMSGGTISDNTVPPTTHTTPPTPPLPAAGCVSLVAELLP